MTTPAQREAATAALLVARAKAGEPHAFDALGRPMLSALGVGEAKIVASEAAFARHGWWLVFLSTITPLSTKLTCIAAHQQQGER